jgi:CheY-like chemotaxis protein
MEKYQRILMVEDSHNDIELILDALSDHNFVNNIDVVRDGEEAMDYLYRRNTYKSRQAGNPIFILLDIKMPRMTGLELLRIIKQDEKMKTIPVIMLTSSREDTDLRECYRLGVNAYVVKPVQFSDFADAVKKIGKFWAVVNEPPPEN